MSAKLFGRSQEVVLMRTLVVFFCVLFLKISFAQQDVGVIGITAPVSGCGLSANESITVQVYNYGSIVNTPFNVSYSINGANPVTEMINTTLLSNAVYTFTFVQKADFSAGGIFTISANTDLAGDVDNSNNALKDYKIIADAFSQAGLVTGATPVCKGSSGSLTLTSYKGNVLYWETSTDGGINWTKETTTSDKWNYANLITTTSYRVLVKNGTCSSDTSPTFTLGVDDPPVGGLLSGTSTVCSGSNSGTLTLSSYTGNISGWEFSTDAGVSWNTLSNTGTSQSYTNLVTTTVYRVTVQSGACPAVYSSPATVSVDPPSGGGNISGSTGVCSGSNTGVLTLTGHSGNIVNWEFSTDGGATWATIPTTAASYTYNNLTTTTQFRTVVKSGTCPQATSSTAIITVDLPAVGGIVSGSDTVCGFSNKGTLILTGHKGSISGWEYSINGGTTWNAIANINDVYTYTNLTVSTLYRAAVQNGTCPPEKSTTASIRVDSVSVGGAIKDHPKVCEGNNQGKLLLYAYQGMVLHWELSVDSGASWAKIQNATISQSFSNLTKSSWYRAIVKSGSCAADTSTVAAIKVVPNPMADAGRDTTITAGKSIVLKGSGGGSYSWSPASGLSDPAAGSPLASPVISTTYTLTVTNADGCKDVDSVTVRVEKEKTAELKIANLITPNGDGFNDTWYIDNIANYPSSHVSIYNAYGQEVYRSDAYKNDWDGTYHGNQLPDGTYYYVVKIGDTEKTFKGAITVLSK